MGTQLLVAVAVLLVALTLLALFGRKSVRAELTIRGTPAEVWSVLTKPASYSAWNPVLVSVEGAFEEGATLSVKMKNPDGSVSVLAQRVVQMVPGRLLRQVGGISGVLTIDHTWRLEAVEGGTKVMQCEVYRGIGVLFRDPVWAGAVYRQANIQLRNLVESRSCLQQGIEHRPTSGPTGPGGASRQPPSPAHADHRFPG